jgi:hypothetical protein
VVELRASLVWRLIMALWRLNHRRKQQQIFITFFNNNVLSGMTYSQIVNLTCEAEQGHALSAPNRGNTRA